MDNRNVCIMNDVASVSKRMCNVAECFNLERPVAPSSSRNQIEIRTPKSDKHTVVRAFSRPGLSVVVVFIHVFFDSHAPNRPRRSATTDNALAVLRTGAVVAVVPAPVPVALMGFFTGLPAPVAEPPRGR